MDETAIAQRNAAMIEKHVEKQEEKQRTAQQNKAIHLLFKHLADQLNESGLDLKKVLLNNPIEIPWNEIMVKEILWREVMKAMYNKKSTTQLTSKEIDKVFEVLNRHLGQKFGIRLDFPSIQTMLEDWRRSNP